MFVRPATLADVPALLELFLRLKRRGPYRTFAHSMDDAARAMRQCISSKQKYLGVIDLKGEILGALMGTTADHWWGPHRYTSDLALFSQVPGGGEQLIRDFCAWSWKQNGVIEVLIAQSSGDAVSATDSLFSSIGFERAGGMYRLSRFDAVEAA